MSIFDEVKRSISSTGKQVAKRTKEISDAVSIRSQINEEKENVAKLYATVGKKVFQNATEADEEKFFMEFTSIRSSLERKRELEERLTGMDGCIYCSECGARIDKNSKFCNKCGTRVDKNKVAANEAMAEAEAHQMDGTKEEEQEAQYRCVAHPLEKHPTRRNLFTDYVADMTVLFSCYKAEDDWEDEHSLKGLVYSYLLGRKFRKKPLLYQEKVRTISLAMQDFADAEKQGNADIDTIAGLFGRVMAQIVSCREDEWKDNLERLGFFLGKFIYLLDAYEDIEQDLKKGTYNPLKKRYEEPGFEEECRQILTMMMSECCKEFEQLPILQNVDILRNILYSGVWCRYEIVRKKRMKDSAKEVTGNDL